MKQRNGIRLFFVLIAVSAFSSCKFTNDVSSAGESEYPLSREEAEKRLDDISAEVKSDRFVAPENLLVRTSEMEYRYSKKPIFASATSLVDHYLVLGQEETYLVRAGETYYAYLDGGRAVFMSKLPSQDQPQSFLSTDETLQNKVSTQITNRIHFDSFWGGFLAGECSKNLKKIDLIEKSSSASSYQNVALGGTESGEIWGIKDEKYRSTGAGNLSLWVDLFETHPGITEVYEKACTFDFRDNLIVRAITPGSDFESRFDWNPDPISYPATLGSTAISDTSEGEKFAQDILKRI